MPPASLLVTSLDFAQVDTLRDRIYQFIISGSLVSSVSEFFTATLPEWLSHVWEWVFRPDVLAILTTWWITFAVVMIIILCLGFGRGGIVAGSAAAAFQSCMYGAFTPAGGIFATLTSTAMVGWLVPHVVILASIVATIVAVIVWRLGME